jgi:hypothetical protein
LRTKFRHRKRRVEALLLVARSTEHIDIHRYLDYSVLLIGGMIIINMSVPGKRAPDPAGWDTVVLWLSMGNGTGIRAQSVFKCV